MAAEIIQYNLPGRGLLSSYMFPYTKCLWDFLTWYWHDTRLKNTKQLGTLENIFPGAHHNRYEYVFVQWSLISELKKINDSANLGLGTKREEFGKATGLANYPTGAEILQSLVLLTNAGHLPDTFTSSRALITRLRSNSLERKAFRSGLDPIDRVFFDAVIDGFAVFSMHYLVMLFLLQRYKRFKEQGDPAETIEYASKVLRAYTNPDNSNHSLARLLSLYRCIRRISYLALDTHYAPVPFSLDLLSIMLNMKESHVALVDSGSDFNKALKQLDEVMRESVYMCGPALLESSRATEQITKAFGDLKNPIKTITAMRELLQTPRIGETSTEIQKVLNVDHLSQYAECDWDKQRLLNIEYSIDNPDLCSSLVKQDVVELEESKRRKIGKTKCRVGAQVDPTRSILALTYSILKCVEGVAETETALRIMADVVGYDIKISKEYKNCISSSNLRYKTLEFALKSIFGWTNRFRLEKPPGAKLDPFFMGRGTSKAGAWIKGCLVELKDNAAITDDYRHELEVAKKVVEAVSSTEAVLCFIGATKLYKQGDTTESAEFDAIFLFPNANPIERFGIIVEAKNQSNGQTTGKKQIHARLDELLGPTVEFSIKPVDTDGVYAEIRLKEQAS